MLLRSRQGFVRTVQQGTKRETAELSLLRLHLLYSPEISEKLRGVWLKCMCVYMACACQEAELSFTRATPWWILHWWCMVLNCFSSLCGHCVQRQGAEPNEHPYRCLLHRTTHRERSSENSRILMGRIKILEVFLWTLMFCFPERAAVGQIQSCFSGWNTNNNYQRQWVSCWWRNLSLGSDYPS